MKKITILSFLVLILFSCKEKKLETALNLAGNNRNELEKVLNHYATNGDDLKLKAAKFLIENMTNKSYYTNSKKEKQLIGFLDSVKKSNPNIDKSLYESLIKEKWGDINISKYTGMRKQLIYDIEFIHSEYLINNIDNAFEAWNNSSWKTIFSFDEFCEYVLPYRSFYAPVSHWREPLKEEYVDIKNKIATDSILELVGAINDNIKWFHWTQTFYELSNIPVEAVNNIQTGTCREHSSLKIGILRSLGIPIVELQAFNSTTWVGVPGNDKLFLDWEYDRAPNKNNKPLSEIRKENFAKIHYLSYKVQSDQLAGLDQKDIPNAFKLKNLVDVTFNYTKTLDIEIEVNESEDHKYAYLCVFDNESKEWEACHWGKINNGKVLFDQMGINRIYLPAYFKDGEYIPAGYPIFIKENDFITLNPKIGLDKIKVYRKTFLYHPEHHFSQLMINSTFEGANSPDFKNSEVLYTIKDKPTHFEKVILNTNKKYRYIRYKSNNSRGIVEDDDLDNVYMKNNSVHIAELVFLDKENDTLKGSFISSDSFDLGEGEKLFDNNIRTNFISDNDCWVGLDLGKPVEVSKIKYLFQNSFNTVEPGDQYELFYWDNEWISLGKKKANDTFLEFNNAPKNVIFLLRNYSQGSDESIFFLENGNQVFG